jgi:hypothetical protein
MKKISAPPSVYTKLEDVIGCKWSVSVLHAIRQGVNRPGALEREIAGISAKVLSERLRKLTHYGLLKRAVFPEAAAPHRVCADRSRPPAWSRLSNRSTDSTANCKRRPLVVVTPNGLNAAFEEICNEASGISCHPVADPSCAR